MSLHFFSSSSAHRPIYELIKFYHELVSIPDIQRTNGNQCKPLGIAMKFLIAALIVTEINITEWRNQKCDREKLKSNAIQTNEWFSVSHSQWWCYLPMLMPFDLELTFKIRIFHRWNYLGWIDGVIHGVTETAYDVFKSVMNFDELCSSNVCYFFPVNFFQHFANDLAIGFYITFYCNCRYFCFSILNVNRLPSII